MGASSAEGFDELKHSLLKDVCSVHLDYSKPFVLEIDASRGALAAVLSQKTNKGESDQLPLYHGNPIRQSLTIQHIG